MTFPPFAFKFPSSSTSLGPNSSSSAPPTKTTGSSTPAVPTVSQFLPPNTPKPSLFNAPKPFELTTTSSLNIAEASLNNVNSSLYCVKKRGQVIELNPANLQLNLIDTVDDSKMKMSFSPSTFIHTLKTWPSSSTPKRILCNGIGNLLAILGSTGNILVVRLGVACIEEIEIDCFEDVVGMAWHPASPADHHLAVLSKTGQLRLYNLLQSHQHRPSSSRPTEDSQFEGESTKFELLSPEQTLKLPVTRTDSFVGLAFSSDHLSTSQSASWLPFTAFLVKESGDVFALCPFLPLQFRAERQRHLIPLKDNHHLLGVGDSTTRKWLDEVLASCQFVSGGSNTDWVLASIPASFSHLQAHIQGPFLIQPEPMEVHRLASFDRVVDFSVFSRIVSGSGGALVLLMSAFGSGKIDLLALATGDISPKFQLKSAIHKSSASDEVTDLLPVLALLESVDLRGGACAISGSPAVKRSVDAPIKVLQCGRTGPILVSTQDSVVSIDLRVSLDDEEVNKDGSAEESPAPEWTISCDATFQLEKLKNHVLCVSEGKVFPGFLKLPIFDSNVIIDGTSSSSSSTSNSHSNSILESITKFAFPLGRMEIEGGAVQLEGLVENLMQTLKRLKVKRTQSITVGGKKLPEIDEIAATELNDLVSEWQESLVSPSMRVGHEIALRSNELVQILKREREILVRAKTLLTAKPGKLERLLRQLGEAKERNAALLERSKRTALELSKYSVYDELLIEKVTEISRKFKEHSISPGEFVELADREDDDYLIQTQLSVQTEKLSKLKAQLLNQHHQMKK